MKLLNFNFCGSRYRNVNTNLDLDALTSICRFGFCQPYASNQLLCLCSKCKVSISTRKFTPKMQNEK